MAECLQRIQHAMQILRGAKAACPAPDFAQANSYDNFSDYRFRWGHWSPPATVDYKREVGNLDGHSLVACVFNYTGTRLPEAKPVIRRTNEDGDTKIDANHPLAQLIRRPNKHHIWANYSQAASIDWW